MTPFDSRLLKYAKEARTYIIFLVLLGICVTLAIAAQTWLIAGAAAPVFYGEKNFRDVTPLIIGVFAIFLVRTLLTYIQHAFGHRSAVKVIARLRTNVLRHAGDLGERWLAGGNTAKIVTHTTRGLDDLEPYFVAFLPELFLCATATPILIVIIGILDWISALLIVLCIPLIPIFMILIGKMTASYGSQRLKAMAELGTQLLDLLAGLATLKALGREQGPKQRVRLLGKRFAEKTMQTLYVAFLSGAALEFIVTLSTAIVAVEVGFRMVAGNLFLFEGLVIIMLTPEAFKPLREVGTQFHASSNGISAAKEAFKVLETPIPQHHGSLPVPDMSRSAIEFQHLSVNAPRRATVAPADLNGRINPGTIAVLHGSSGSGKSTTISALLGLIQPDSGRILIDGIDLSEIRRDEWWNHITWVPQRPALVPGTVWDNMCVTSMAASAHTLPAHTSPAGSKDDSHRKKKTVSPFTAVNHNTVNLTTSAAQAPEPNIPPALKRACFITGFNKVVESLPEGWNTRIGQGGVGLSVGQRQRLALTRALTSTRHIIILDEPSAHLDAASEEYVTRTIQELKATGHTVIVIAHRAPIVQLADTAIEVSASTRDMSDYIERVRTERTDAADKARREAEQLDYALPASLRRNTYSGDGAGSGEISGTAPSEAASTGGER